MLVEAIELVKYLIPPKLKHSRSNQQWFLKHPTQCQAATKKQWPSQKNHSEILGFEEERKKP